MEIQHETMISAALVLNISLLTAKRTQPSPANAGILSTAFVCIPLQVMSMEVAQRWCLPACVVASVVASPYSASYSSLLERRLTVWPPMSSNCSPQGYTSIKSLNCNNPHQSTAQKGLMIYWHSVQCQVLSCPPGLGIFGWREQLPQCTNKTAFQNYVLRPLSNSKKDAGIELAQHFKIRSAD